MASLNNASPNLYKSRSHVPRSYTEDLSNNMYNQYSDYEYNDYNEDNEQSKATFNFAIFQRNRPQDKTKEINDTKTYVYDLDEDTKPIKNPYILIIGIVKYDAPNQSLRGVKNDIIKMKQLWEIKYHFKHVYCINDDLNSTKINKEQLNKWLNRQRNKIDDINDTIDGLIILYSGHGGNHGSDYLICSDNQKYEINDVHKKFSSLQCDNLCGKPKIYYFDCCRVKEEEHKQSNEYAKGNGARPRLVNEDSDIFMHYACCNSKESKVTDKGGSYMINAISNCYSMNLKSGKIANLNKISQRINKEINIAKHGQQTPEIINRLTYDICIIPAARDKNNKRAPISVNQSHQPFYNAGLDIQYNNCNQKPLFANQNPLFTTRPREYSKSSIRLTNHKSAKHNSASLMRKKSNPVNNRNQTQDDFKIIQPQQQAQSQLQPFNNFKPQPFNNFEPQQFNNFKPQKSKHYSQHQYANKYPDKINFTNNEIHQPFIPPSPQPTFNLKPNTNIMNDPFIPPSPDNVFKRMPNKINQSYTSFVPPCKLKSNQTNQQFMPPLPDQIFKFQAHQHAIFTCNGKEYDVRVISVNNPHSQIVIMFNNSQTRTVHPHQLKKKRQPIQRKMHNNTQQRNTYRNNGNHHRGKQQNANLYANMKAQSTSPRNFMHNR